MREGKKINIGGSKRNLFKKSFKSPVYTISGLQILECKKIYFISLVDLVYEIIRPFYRKKRYCIGR